MAVSYNGVPIPTNGRRIGYANGNYDVPDNPIIPFIEGDGTGRDIWKASVRVFDAAVEKAYKGKRRIVWYEVFAGEKAMANFNTWLPDDSVAAIREFRVAIKGPLTTPVGGGIRSLNVALRQILDLYSCIRPVKYYKGVPSPVKHPERMDVVIYRENTEDVYAGIEWEEGTPEAAEADRVPEQRHVERRQEANTSRLGRRHQADFDYRHETPGSNGDQVRAETGRKMSPWCTKETSRNLPREPSASGDTNWRTEEFRDKVVTERESWILDNKDKNPEHFH